MGSRQNMSAPTTSVTTPPAESAESTFRVEREELGPIRWTSLLGLRWQTRGRIPQEHLIEEMSLLTS